MKVLHVLDHSLPLHSGYTFRTRAILEAQRALGWQTVHLTSVKQGEGAAAIGEADGLRFYRTPASAGPLVGLPVINQWDVVRGLARRIDEVIAVECPDVLHAHSPCLTGIAAIRAGRRHRLPVVYECRAFWEDAAADHGTGRAWGPRYRLTRALESWVFRHCDAVTCICEGLRSDILARGIPNRKVTVVPNGVDVARFPYGIPADPKLSRSLGLDGATVLGFLGSFYTYEGLALLLQALPRILAERPEVRLLMVGGGPEEGRLRQLVGELKLDAHAILPGRVPHDEVQRYYSLVDVLVYPRLPMRLTDLVTPLKPLEAMAQGKLVLASDVGGHRELIDDGKTGRLFDAGDATALANATLRLLAERDCWESQRREGRAFVERERSWTAIVERYGAVYGGLRSRPMLT